MTELAQINEHSTEIANPENQTENIQSFSQMIIHHLGPDKKNLNQERLQND